MKETEQAIRAARSYARNEELVPKAEERLAKARSLLEGYLLRTGQTALRLGGYQIEMIDGAVRVSHAPPEGWEQTELEGLRPSRSGVGQSEQSGS